jgi:hypothetical protein
LGDEQDDGGKVHKLPLSSRRVREGVSGDGRYDSVWYGDEADGNVEGPRWAKSKGRKVRNFLAGFFFSA